MTKKQLKITVMIDDREYSRAELDAVFNERSYFTLREMQELGADLRDDLGAKLTRESIDEISENTVREGLFANKLRLRKDKQNRLYEPQYREADEMWKGILAESAPGDYSQKVARAHIIITGISAGMVFRLLGKSFNIRKMLLEVEPDHIDTTATSVTEIMGMYGRPTAMKGKLTGVKRPEAPSPDHPIRLLGQSHLASDPSVVNAVAYHQMKFIKGGIDVLTNAYFPTATPQELVDGHSVHMGVEFSNLFWNAAKK